MEKIVATIPMEKLVSAEKNMYEITSAAIRRAKQITLTGTEDFEPGKGKIVSIAIKEIISGEVQYTRKED